MGSFARHMLFCGLAPILALLFTPTVQAETLKTGQIHEKIVCQKEPNYSYSLYLPKSYQSDKTYPLVLIFEPAARSTLPLSIMQGVADEFDYILLCSRDTRNFIGYPTNFAAAKAIWQDADTRFKIDRNRTYTAGFSGGARLGSEIAIVTGTIAGHIACGAGFRDTSHASKKIGFPVALAIGNQDMNYMELTDINRKLSFTKSTHRFFEFDAGHQWPPPETFRAIIKWFNLLAMKKGTMPRDDAFIRSNWQEDALKAKAWEKDGQLVAAQRRLAMMARDYEGLIDTGYAFGEAARIRNMPAYKEVLQRITRLENAEKMRQRRYVRDLRKQGAELPEDVSEFSALMRPWIQEKQSQDRHIKTTKNEDEKLMAQRLNDFAWRMCSERGQLLFSRENFREALYVNLVVTVYKPEFAFSYINAARCYAKLGANSEALVFLKRAIGLGINNLDAVRDDPAFLRLSANPKFQELFQSN